MNPWAFRQAPVVEKPKAKFVKDESLPDRAVVLPSQTLVKTWKVQNTGAVEWPKGTKLIFFRGDRALSTEEEFDVPLAKAGEAVDVSAVITTPSLSLRASNGRHTAVFRLADQERTPFGPRLWCDVLVADVSKPKGDEKGKPEEKARVAEKSSAHVDSAEALPVSASAVSSASASAASASASASSASASASSASSSSAPTSEARTKWSVQLGVLASMGFTNEELNVCLLENNSGNVQKVCEFLIHTLYN